MKYPLINVPVTSPLNVNYMISALMKNLFGARIRPVLGYVSTPDLYLAIARGEADGGCGTWDSLPKEWASEKKANFIVRLTERVPAGMPDMPYIMDFANDEQKRFLRSVLTASEAFRPYIVAGEVPTDRVAVLRKAFMAAVTSNTFLEEAANTQRTIESPMEGAEVARRVNELYSLSPEVRNRLKQLVQIK